MFSYISKNYIIKKQSSNSKLNTCERITNFDRWKKDSFWENDNREDIWYNTTNEANQKIPKL